MRFSVSFRRLVRGFTYSFNLTDREQTKNKRNGQRTNRQRTKNNGQKTDIQQTDRKIGKQRISAWRSESLAGSLGYECPGVNHVLLLPLLLQNVSTEATPAGDRKARHTRTCTHTHKYNTHRPRGIYVL